MGAKANTRGKRDSSHQAQTFSRAADAQPSQRQSTDTAMRPPSPSRRSVQRRLNHRKAVCAKGETFAISSRSFPLSEGCYSQLTQYNGEAMYSPNASRDNGSSNYVIGATQGDKNDPNDFRWSLVYADSGNTKESFSLCQSVQSASTTHPANAMWACDLAGNGDLTIVNQKNFSVSCGCPSVSGDTNTRLDPPPSTVRSRAFGCGLVFVFGVFSLCCAFVLKQLGGRKKYKQQPKYVRVTTVEDSL